MRRLLAIFLLLPFTCVSQQIIQLKARVNQLPSGEFDLIVNARLVDGWYVYAHQDQNLGLDAPTFVFEAEFIKTKFHLTSEITPHFIFDEIFSSNLPVYYKEFILRQVISFDSTVPSTFNFTLVAYAANGKEFIPINKTLQVRIKEGEDSNDKTALLLTSVDLKNPVADCGEKQNEEEGILGIFLLGIGGGLLALLTPCVFPMVPVTVSFFTNRSRNRRHAISNGLFYGIFILLVYLAASIPFHLMGELDPQILNSISTNSWVNIFFFLVFLVFALSFFGLFEIRLPTSISNMAGSKSSISNTGGIFFMALTLAVVSFSCTGPILGSLLVGSLSSAAGAWELTAGMAGFGIALGLPFALFAIFPQWLEKLPKSGKWMQTVKISLAFVELALALKFLSNADLVEHWGILKREVFIGLWFFIALLLSLYLLGVFEKRQVFQPSPRLSIATGKRYKPALPKLRIYLGGLILLFALYLLPGVTTSSYANLKLLSGFPPPLSYSIYGKSNVHGKGVEPDVVNNYEKALVLSKQQNKPILIDFTGWACVNCRKMEEQVWTKPDVKELIKEKFILLSLYVDDREKLPVSERIAYVNSDGIERQIKTIGDKWASFQQENFKQVTQPLYVVLSPDQELLNNPVGYTPDAGEYKEWLECGVDAMRKRDVSRSGMDKNSLVKSISTYRDDNSNYIPIKTLVNNSVDASKASRILRDKKYSGVVKPTVTRKKLQGNNSN